jgi:hypothetical protein
VKEVSGPLHLRKKTLVISDHKQIKKILTCRIIVRTLVLVYLLESIGFPPRDDLRDLSDPDG